MAEEKKLKLTPQKAVEAAVKYLAEVVGGLEQPKHLSVEKISISRDRKTWTVVLAYDREGVDSTSLSVLLGNSPRKYRTIDIEDETGDGISMDIYNPNKS